MGIGKRIKEAREALHLTQKELGDMVGVTGSSITNYENETSHPEEPIMYKLINELGIDANFLFQDSVDIKKASSSVDEDALSECEKIARAYEVSDDGIKCAVRKLLDVSRPAHIPDMDAIQKECKKKAAHIAQNLTSPTKK